MDSAEGQGKFERVTADLREGDARGVMGSRGGQNRG